MAFQVPTSKSPRPVSRPTMTTPGPQAGQSRREGGPSWLKGLVTLIVIIVIIGGGIYLIADFIGIGLPARGGINLKNDWQAVFLSNGQVYFGKITKITEEVVVLKDIYYLQIVTQPLQRSQEGEAPAEPQQTEQRLTLIKLGNEIHGPRDEMMINRNHIVIIEDLKDNSRVVQAINDYISQGKQQ